MSSETVFIAATPYDGMKTVTLTADTWHQHIQPQRPALRDRPQWIQATVTAPTAVCVGTSDENNYCFVNHGLVTATGHPLVVFVNGEGLVDTAGFRRDFATLAGKTVLWRPS